MQHPGTFAAQPETTTPTRQGAMAAREWIVARAFFPLVLGGAVFWSIAPIEAGAEPASAVFLPMLLSYGVIAAVERIVSGCPGGVGRMNGNTTSCGPPGSRGDKGMFWICHSSTMRGCL